MKKLPIILASLSLCGINVMLPFLQVEASDRDRNYTLPNTIESITQPYYVIPKRGTIDFRFSTNRSGLAFKDIEVYAFDYENGMTRAEADASLAKLGVEEVAGMKKVGAYTMPDYLVSAYSAFSTVEDKNWFETNRSDVVYFVAQFGNYEKTDKGEVVWTNLYRERGIIDYRNCAHDENVPTQVTCRPLEAESGDRYEYWPYGRKHEITKPVLTWEEEWRMIQEERLAGVEEEINNLDIASPEVKTQILDLQGKLAKIEVNLAKMSAVEELEAKRLTLVKRLEELLEEIKKNEEVKDPTTEEGDKTEEKDPTTEGGDKTEEKDPTIGDDKTEENKPAGSENEDENGGITGGDTEIGEDSSNFTKPGVGDSQSSTEFQGDYVSQRDQNVQSEQSEQRVQRSQIAQSTGSDQKSWLRSDSQTSSETSKSDITGLTADTSEETREHAEEILSDKTEAEQKTEVPKLGGKENKFNFWTILLPTFVGLLVLLWLWLKRAFGWDEEK